MRATRGQSHTELEFECTEPWQTKGMRNYIGMNTNYIGSALKINKTEH